jgi:hypothetical protein
MIGALIAIPGLAGPLVVKPYLYVLSAIWEETSVERDRLARERRAIAALPALPAARTRVSQQLDKELNRLFQSSNELVSTGDLAQYVAAAAQENGVSLQQSETRPARMVVPGVQALQLEIHAAGDLDGLLHFVHQLESGGKLVRFGVLSIDGGRGPLDAAMNTGTSPIRPFAAASTAETTGPNMIPRRSFARKSVPDLPGAKGSTVEVLSLSGSVYGYRLSGTQWSSVNTHEKSAASPFSRESYALESLDAILDHDPFNATRTRPFPSYRLAMTQPVQSLSRDSMNVMRMRQQQQEMQQFQQQFHLLGTVLGSGNTNFVMGQNGNGPPRVVRVGEQMNGYTLASLDRGTAVFTSPSGERVYLHTANPAEDVTPTAEELAFYEKTRGRVGNMPFDQLPPEGKRMVLNIYRSIGLAALAESVKVHHPQQEPSNNH